MKMLYVLSPPHTPPPSPWTSMRDSSPPLSCPSSNSNSSSSINSSYSYSSSQSGRDNTSTRNRIGKENSSQSRLNSGDGVSTRSKLESFPQSARNSSTKNNIQAFNGNSGDEYSRENSGRVASVVLGGGKSRLLSGGETSSSVNSSQRKDGCSNVSRGDLGSARHFQWKKFESKSCDVDVHSSKTLPHICNSQSEKIFPGRRHHLEHPIRSSQSERRGSTVTDHQAEKWDSTGGDGRARVVCRSKQSKATRIWLNAIAKANARGTSAVPSGHIGGDERDLFGDDSDFIGESEPIGGAERGDGEEREGSVGRGKKEDAEVALPAERHFGKNVKKCRLKRKVNA